MCANRCSILSLSCHILYLYVIALPIPTYQSVDRASKRLNGNENRSSRQWPKCGSITSCVSTTHDANDDEVRFAREWRRTAKPGENSTGVFLWNRRSNTRGEPVMKGRMRSGPDVMFLAYRNSSRNEGNTIGVGYDDRSPLHQDNRVLSMAWRMEDVTG